MDNIYITNVLNSTYIKENFDCNKDLLNGYIHKQASQDVKRRISACFVLTDDDKIIKGDSTEIALMEVAREQNIQSDTWSRIAEIAFDADRKLMTTFHSYNNKIISFTTKVNDFM
jgi:Ca2+-transporting ATPase